MKADAPPQVRWAFWLLWVSFGLSLGDAICAVLLAEPEEAGTYLNWAFTAGIYVVIAALIYAASLRQNWARIVLLLVTLSGMGSYVVMFVLGELVAEPWWSNAITIATVTMDIVALYWLFLGEGRQWFASRPG